MSRLINLRRFLGQKVQKQMALDPARSTNENHAHGKINFNESITTVLKFRFIKLANNVLFEILS